MTAEPTQTTKVTQCELACIVTRTRIYRAVVTPDLLARLDTVRHAQRAVYNIGITCVAAEGGPIPALHNAPDAPDAFFALLTGARAEHPWLQAITHCQELGQLLDAVTKRLAEHALNPDPSEVQYIDLMLMLDSTDDIPYEVARVQAIARAMAIVAHTG